MKIHSFYGWHVALLALAMLVGCGGLSQDDIRRYAINRPSDDDVDQKPVAVTVPKAAQQPITSPTPTPATTIANVNPSAEIPVPTGVSPETLSDTIQPGAPLSATDRRQRTINNLEKIGKAFESYFTQHNVYPSHAIYDGGKPTLSWRVELLPYLGYRNLYDQFNKSEPWDGPTNKALLPRIPSVYQSPERFDDRTNYLVPFGTSTPFFSQQRKPPRRWEDGKANVALVLEVDDSLAQPWTKPTDYIVSPPTPMVGLGGLREDGLFMVWCGGQVARIAPNTAPVDIRAMYTIDGGETLSASTISLAAEANPTGAGQSALTVASAGFPPTTSTTVTTRIEPAKSSSAGATDDLVHRAQHAFERGWETEAVQLAYIALLTERLDAAHSFRWISGLKRPAAFVRFGIAVDYAGTNKQRFESLYPNETRGWNGKKAVFIAGAGLLGERTLEYLEKLEAVVPPEIGFGVSATKSDSQSHSKTDRIRPGVTFLALGESSEMLRFAELKEIDVLLMFNVEERAAIRTSAVNHLVTLEAFDVLNRKSLYKSKQISYRKRERELRNALYEDPIEITIRELASLIELKLTATELPSTIDAKLVAKRADWLTRKGTSTPLRLLAELHYYKRIGLLSLDQALTRYQSILGAENGLELLAGEITDRDKALAPFVPRYEISDP